MWQQQMQKNQANIFIFGCAMAQKPDKGNDVTFETQFFGISKWRTTKQMTFLESLDNTGQDRYVLKENIDCKIWPFLTWS